MNVLVKQGSLDNAITYEHYCDTKADLANIPKTQMSLGSVAIVLKDENDGMGVYIATSTKEWVAISMSSSSSDEEQSSTPVTFNLLHICTSNEYDSETGEPTINEPEENTIYLVPNNSNSNNLFDEWIYANENWEKFGNTSLEIPTPDWNAASGAPGYIANKPAITSNSLTLGSTTLTEVALQNLLSLTSATGVDF